MRGESRALRSRTKNEAILPGKNDSMNWKQHITVDPDVLVGRAIIRGTRLSVELILDRLADGWTPDDLLRSYPKLSVQAIQAVLVFASEMMRDRKRPLPIAGRAD